VKLVMTESNGRIGISYIEQSRMLPQNDIFIKFELLEKTGISSETTIHVKHRKHNGRYVCDSSAYDQSVHFTERIMVKKQCRIHLFCFFMEIEIKTI
jgi:hypothetical protein